MGKLSKLFRKLNSARLWVVIERFRAICLEKENKFVYNISVSWENLTKHWRGTIMSDFTFIETIDEETYVDRIIEKFCILTDWDVRPEDISAVAESDGIYFIYLKDDSSFTYDSANDCLID